MRPALSAKNDRAIAVAMPRLSTHYHDESPSPEVILAPHRLHRTAAGRRRLFGAIDTPLPSSYNFSLPWVPLALARAALRPSDPNASPSKKDSP
jgi:hypothetical protein